MRRPASCASLFSKKLRESATFTGGEGVAGIASSIADLDPGAFRVNCRYHDNQYH
jgi:hypothetical protein